MMRPFIRSLLSLTLLLCLSMAARGQTTITIYGDSTVCAGSSMGYYEFTYVPPVNPDSVSYHTWTIVRGSVALDIPPSNKQILWGAPGAGKIIVNGYNDSNRLVATDTMNITIVAEPTPSITTETRVACQPLIEPDEFHPLGGFDDSAGLQVCAYNQVIYTAHGDPASTYSWSVTGNGTVASATGQTAVISWGAPGAAKITVQETSPEGCIGTSSQIVDIIESPIAHFVSLPDTSLRTLQVCKGTEVIFIDKSSFSPSSPIVAWRWDFGDGNFSNQKGSRSAPVTHKYEDPGFYLVRLTVTNQCGCSTEETMGIQVDPDAGVKIVCPGVVCDGGTYNYHVDSSCNGGTWDVLGGTILTHTGSYISIKWDQVGPDGYGYIIYDPGGCQGYCPYPVAVKVPVVKSTADIEGPNYLCVDKEYLYTMPQWPSTRYKWTISNSNVILDSTDQPNEIVLIPNAAAGTVTLTCAYTNTLLGCSGVASMQVSIPGKAVITDTVFDFCEGVETVFHLAGPNMYTGNWTLVKPDHTIITAASGNQFNVVLDEIGSYMLSVTGDFCPPDPVEVRVIGYPSAPEFIQGPSAICKGVPEEYVAGAIDSRHIFEWSVDKGSSLNTVVGEVTDVTLNKTASYPFHLSVVRVTKDKPHCKSDTFTKEILMPQINMAITGTDSVCPSQYYHYNVSAFPEPESYQWVITPATMGSIDKGQGTADIKVLWNKQPGLAKLSCRLTKCYDAYTDDTMYVYVRPLGLNLTVSADTVCQSAPAFAQVDVATSGVNWYDGVSSYTTDRGVNFTTLPYSMPLQVPTLFPIEASVDSPYGCATKVYARDSIVIVPSPRLFVSPNAVYTPCDAMPNVNITSSYDPNGVPPTTYTWVMGPDTVGLASSYTLTDTGKLQLIAASSNGCEGMTEVSIFYRHDCDRESTPADSGGSDCSNKYALFNTVSLQDVCGGIIYVNTKVSDSASFDHATWRSGNDSLTQVTATSFTGNYKPKIAGVYHIWYTAWFSDGNGGLCSSVLDTIVHVPIVPGLDVRPLCTESAGHRDIKYTDLTTATSQITSRTYYEYQGGNYISVHSGNDVTWTGLTLDTANVGAKKKFQLVVTTGSQTCTLRKSQSVMPLPTAGFTVVSDSVCEKDAPVFFVNTSYPPASNLDNLWDFGDQSQNKQPAPYRVYTFNPTLTSIRNVDVTLFVTDPWGCSDTAMHSVQIMPDKLDGEVEISPSFPCEHTVATATYKPGINSSSAVQYEWYDKKAIYLGDSSSTWDVYKSGYYYAHAIDKYGCLLNAKGDTVTFIRVAPAFIFGDQSQCKDVPFTLTGYAGQVAGLTYKWMRDSSLIAGATKADLTEQISTPGTYTYQVITTMPSPAGGFCSDTSDGFAVVVHPNPAPPVVSYNVLDCDDYTIRLNILPNLPGTYNWSNGMSGKPITVHHGGPYQVIYTDSNGCKSKTRLETPRDLREYLWMFPTGCYSLCATDPNIITGPIMKFNQWNYRKNGLAFTGVAYSTTPSSFYDISLNGTGAGFYQMFLRNVSCNILSDTMTVDYKCTKGGPGTGRRMEQTGIKDLVSAPVILQLAPNPAGNRTQVSYRYRDNGTPAMVEVYDMLGRIVYGRQLNDAGGSFDMALEDFVPGTYRVVLRQGGDVLQQCQLSVTH